MLQGFQTADAGHTVVQQHHIGWLTFYGRHAFLAAGGLDHLVEQLEAGAAEELARLLEIGAAAIYCESEGLETGRALSARQELGPPSRGGPPAEQLSAEPVAQPSR